MQCPHCNEELEFDGEWSDSTAELDHNEVVGSVEITLICMLCYENLGEYSFELEQDISDFAEAHEDEEEGHEMSVEVSAESFIKMLINNGQFLGAEATVIVNCACGAHVEYLWSTTERAEEVMKELDAS